MYTQLTSDGADLQCIDWAHWDAPDRSNFSAAF